MTDLLVDDGNIRRIIYAQHVAESLLVKGVFLKNRDCEKMQPTLKAFGMVWLFVSGSDAGAEPWIYLKTGDGAKCKGTAAEGHCFPVAGTPKPDANGRWSWWSDYVLGEPGREPGQRVPNGGKCRSCALFLGERPRR